MQRGRGCYFFYGMLAAQHLWSGKSFFSETDEAFLILVVSKESPILKNPQPLRLVGVASYARNIEQVTGVLKEI